MPLQEICRQVGVQPCQVGKWKKHSEPFNTALATEHNRSQQVVNMSRKVVMRGLLESIDMAKDMRQPSTMISGWKEVGRMCGFYEPERREITFSVDGQKLLQEMKSVSREKLLELVSEQDAIEADFEVVDLETSDEA